MGDGRAEELLAIGDRGCNFVPDVNGMHIHIFEISQLKGLYVGDLTEMQKSARSNPRKSSVSIQV